MKTCDECGIHIIRTDYVCVYSADCDNAMFRGSEE